MSRKRLPGLVSLGWVFLVLSLGRDASAQVTTAVISGTVKDETGAILPAATVTAKHLETATTRTATTDAEGRYRIPALPLGGYEVTVSLTGFQTAVRSGITLTVGREAIVDFTLKVGAVAEMVTVQEEAPLVQTTTSTLAGLVDEKKIRDLPLNGRSFGQLALLEVGVNSYLNNRPGFFNGRGLKIVVNGTRFNHTSFLLDGSDVNDIYNNTPGSVAGIFLGVETVREFQTVTQGMSAEYGRSPGMIVNAVTKSGTKELHGSVFEFLRNSALDAKNFFDPVNKSIPPFKRNQFGFTVGGPLVRDRTFFFGSYEGLRERLGVTKVAQVPTLAARQGIVPGQPPIAVNPAVLPYLDIYPAPNGRELGGGIAEDLFSFKQPANENFFQIRGDHRFSDSDSFFARYTFDDGDATRLVFDTPVFQEPENSRNQYLTLEYKRIFSPTVLNTFRFGLNRSTSAFFDELAPGAKQGPPFLPVPLMGQLIVGGLTTVGTEFRGPVDNVLNLFEYSDDVVVTRGRHFLKTGFNIKRFQYNNTQIAWREGNYTFPTLAALLTATPAVFVGSLPGSDFTRSNRQWMFGFYFQDDFKLRPNFTLNLGLRYEFITVPEENHGRSAAFRHATDSGGTLGPPFENPSRHNFAPRIGLAWAVFGNNKTAIRAGWGIFYDQFIANHLLPNLNLIHPLWKFFLRPAPPFPNPLLGLDPARVIPSTFSTEFELEQPTLLHYNFGVEQELFRNTVFRIGYAGSHGNHLGTLIDSNAAIPDILPDGRKFFPVGRTRRNPNFGFNRHTVQESTSFYNSLQLGVERRFGQGLQFQASYTWSKFLDDGSIVNTSDSINTLDIRMDADGKKAERGLSNFDIRHNLTFNYTYELPFGPGRKFGSDWTGLAARLGGGWDLNGIVTLTSGNPFTLNLAFNQSRSTVIASAGLFPDRPNLRPQASNNPVLGGPDRYFDPSAFELQPPGFFGNLGRNTLIGPGLATFDFSVVKNLDMGLGKDRRLQFRAEFFNLFNRPNFGTPLTTIFDPTGSPLPTAGRITRTVTTSRQIQFALKFLF